MVIIFLYRVFSYFENFLFPKKILKEISPKTEKMKRVYLWYKYEIQRGTLKKATLRKESKVAHSKTTYYNSH